MDKSADIRKPTFLYAVVILLTIVAFMAVGMVYFKASIQVMMFLAWIVFALFAFRLGWTYDGLERAAFAMVHQAMQAIVLMAAVGVLISAWIAAGTVPSIIYAGLVVISPKFFLLTATVLCSLTSVATGSSWTTMGTVGLAMLGIGAGLGIPAGLTAGAIISGAYFGDKMSPLSDSTNLAAAVCRVNIFTHIKHMLYTTGPAFIISCIIYTVLGFRYADRGLDSAQIESIMQGFQSMFHIGWLTMIPAVVVLVMIFRKASPVFALLVGAMIGLAIAVLYQGFDLAAMLTSFWKGFEPPTSDPLMVKFLKRGGLQSMMSTIALMIFALGLGGMMRESGVLQVILERFAKNIRSVGRLVASTMVVSYLASMISGSMHFSAVITSTLMDPLYDKQDLRPENLSRVIEDCGTLGAVLIPWSTNAVFTMGMLQVTYLEYAPYALLNYIDPIISLFLGVTGITMYKKVRDGKAPDA